MSHNHKLDQDLRFTSSNPEEAQKEEEKELDNGELEATAGGAPPPEAYLDPNVHYPPNVPPCE